VVDAGTDGRGSFALTSDQQNRIERLVMEHLDSVFNGALRLTHNVSDAEDLVQDAVFRAMRGFHSFQEDTNFKAWLFRIMTNVYINNYRVRARQPRRAEEVELADLKSPARLADPESVVMARMETEYLQRAIEDLPSESRTVVMLADEQGFSYDEIAKIIKRPVGTVRSRLHRGRRMLKRRLQQYAQEAGYA
jgi:RNA polymerase sigma-70 factor (ECF subfamily)